MLLWGAECKSCSLTFQDVITRFSGKDNLSTDFFQKHGVLPLSQDCEKSVKPSEITADHHTFVCDRQQTNSRNTTSLGKLHIAIHLPANGKLVYYYMGMFLWVSSVGFRGGQIPLHLGGFDVRYGLVLKLPSLLCGSYEILHVIFSKTSSYCVGYLTLQEVRLDGMWVEWWSRAKEWKFLCATYSSEISVCLRNKVSFPLNIWCFFKWWYISFLWKPLEM